VTQYVIDTAVDPTAQGPGAVTSHDGAGYHGGSHNNAARDPITDLVTVTAGLAQELIDRAAADAAEAAARAAADTVLLGDITAEAAARASADTILQTNITAEATTRAAADTALSTRVTTLEGLTEAKILQASSQQLTSNSTVFQNITSFGLSLLANAVWRFRGTILYNCTAAADFKFQFTLPAGAVIYGSVGPFFDPAATYQAPQLLVAGGAFALLGDGTTRGCEFSGTVVNGGTAGTMQLQAAQNTATVETTDFLVVDSNMIATRLP
jgi:hypothetical protein